MDRKRQYERAKQWVQDAIEDGWLIQATYKAEPIESAATLKKEGFEAIAIIRYRPEKRKDLQYDAGISVWGPDGLAVMHGTKYSWEELNKNLRVCDHCNKQDVKTVRICFAGRCCEDCLPELRKKYETSGWYD